MNILLVSMPDTVPLINSMVSFPSIGITSLAGNLCGHNVKIVDLVVYGKNIRKPLQKAIDEHKPHIVGLSAMIFQFDTLLKVASFIKKNYPGIKIAAGGYHATLMYKEISSDEKQSANLDFLIRGEGEISFRYLADELGKENFALEKIKGLSFKQGKEWKHNDASILLDLSVIPIPARDARITQDFRMLGRKNLRLDVFETSRGCPFNCKFCSITQMYGKTFRRFPISRIVEDIKNIKRLGFNGAFLADDNIIYDAEHFNNVCDAIIDNKLNDMFYSVQVSAIGVAKNPELVKKMSRANFRLVFVGFESMIPSSLKDMTKPTNPEINIQAAKLLRQNGIAIVAGLIAGNPDDDYETVKKNFSLVRDLRPDVTYPQYLTPYPKTLLRDELLAAGLIVNKDNFSSYDGYTCNIRTSHLTQRKLFRALQIQMLKEFFDSRHLKDNWFLKTYPFSFFKKMVGYNFFRIILNILTGEVKKRNFDI